MDPTVIVAILQTVRVTMEFIQAQQQGNTQAAIEAVSGQLPPGLDDDVAELVELGQVALGYLARRGISVDQSIMMIKKAQDEHRDLTVDEVSSLLATLQSELSTTQSLIDRMED